MQYRNLIARLIGTTPEAVDPTWRRLRFPQPPRNLALNIPGETLRNRPAVRMAEAKVMSALARYAQAKSALFPSLSIGGSFGRSGIDHGPAR